MPECECKRLLNEQATLSWLVGYCRPQFIHWGDISLENVRILPNLHLHYIKKSLTITALLMQTELSNFTGNPADSDSGGVSKWQSNNDTEMREWMGVKHIQKGKEAESNDELETIKSVLLPSLFFSELKWNSFKDPFIVYLHQNHPQNIIWAERGSWEKSFSISEALKLLVHLYYEWFVSQKALVVAKLSTFLIARWKRLCFYIKQLRKSETILLTE